ncbi:MAG: metallophosphoesterase [Alphaproteobacteria bacterium]
MSFAPAQAPANTRIYAVGDVHGMDDKLRRVLANIYADAQGFAGQKQLVFVGDYIDRGLNSKGVVNLVLQGLDGFTTTTLLGNHDWQMQRFLAGAEDRHTHDWLYLFGGAATLGSYGVQATPTRKLAELRTELQATIPASHVAFYSQLQHFAVSGGYLFVHAGVKPKVALEKQQLDDLIFPRPAHWHNHGLPYRIVFGHTIFEQPLVEAERIGIDTGAYAGGPLTCAVLEGADVRFLQG